MKLKNFILLCIVVVSVPCATEKNFAYPAAKQDDTYYELHGEIIKDPYQWLENKTLTETKEFMDAQNELTQSFLEKDNLKSKVREKVINIYKRVYNGLPKRFSKYYYSFRNSGLQNQNILCKQTDLTEESVDVVLDPNKLSEDNSIVLGKVGISGDGNWVAYGTNERGSEWFTVKVRNVDNLKDNLDEELRFVRSSKISWMKDHKGFFYSGYTEKAFKTNKLENHTVFYHRVGQTQDKDVPVYTHPNPLWRVQSQVSHDGKYLVLDLAHDSMKTALFIGELPADGEIKGRIECKPIVPTLQWDQRYIANIGPKFILRTDQHASNNRLVSFDFNTFNENQTFTDFIAEHPTKHLTLTYPFDKDKLILVYAQSQNALDIHWLSNGTHDRSIPIKENMVEEVIAQYSSSEIFYCVHNVLSPEITYKYDFSKPDEKPMKLWEKRWNGFDEKKYTLEQMYYLSKDNTKVPLLIIKKKDMQGPKPCLLFGYGGFGAVTRTKLNPFFVYFLNEFDGFIAIALVRGEGVFPGWHDRGRKLNKQKCFDDFQWAARFLAKKGYTKPKLTVINGVSHGGLLVATCVNQAPELFGVAIAEIGVMDMLRYHTYYLGHAYVEEFGNPENKTEFDVIRKYSPLHNIQKAESEGKQYPSFLMLAGENDERAVPCHSMKFAAELQHDNAFQTNPILLRVYKGVGHSHSKTIYQSIEEVSDKLTFIHKVLNVEVELE